MINLIPPTAKAMVVREYWVRVVTAWAWLLGVACIIVGILLVPVYVSIVWQLNSFSSAYADASAQSADLKEIQETLREAQTDARLLLAFYDDKTSVTTYLERIEQLANDGISLSMFRFERGTAGQVDEISVVGQAATRQDLADYQAAVVADELFEKMEVPRPNLAKDVDLSFQVTIVPVGGADPAS